MNKKFDELVLNNLGTLKQYVPIVNKVHGPSHPEFHKVKDEFDILSTKIDNNDLNLTKEFDTLKEITNNYTIPNGVCESYEAVYNMLENLDKAYREDL